MFLPNHFNDSKLLAYWYNTVAFSGSARLLPVMQHVLTLKSLSRRAVCRISTIYLIMLPLYAPPQLSYNFSDMYFTAVIHW